MQIWAMLLMDVDANMVHGWPLPLLRRRRRVVVGRLYGGSPAPYLAADRFRAIRRQGISLVLDAGGILS
jgi:hypothetical protein